MFKNRKAQAAGFATILPLVGLGLGVVVLGIILAVGAQILGETRDDLTVDSAEYNITVEQIENVSAVSGKVGIIITVAVLGIILAVLIGVVAIFLRGGGGF